MPDAPDHYPPLSVLATGSLGRCPRCGEGKLFDGLLAIAPSCEVCSLDLRGHDAGDGPAVFVILLLGAIMMVLVFWLEFTYEPPWWVHMVLWLPLLTVAAIAMLRVLKGILVAQQYKHRSTAL